MVGTYAPRVPVHPDRHGARKTQGPNLWAVLHSSEGDEGPNAAEALAAYMGRPGDRPNGSGGVYGSSYHVVFDTDRIIPAVPYDVVAYSAGGGNARGIHGCFPGRAGQTRAQWLDADSRPMIRQCAAWLLDLQAAGIPLRRIYPGDLRAGTAGVCDHHDVSLAFHKSTHTDVGDGFPWDVLFADVAELIEGDPDMPTARPVALIQLEGTNPVYAQHAAGKWWVPDRDTLDALRFVYRLEVQVVPRGALGLMAASGPILGDRPAGVDGYGRPL